MTPEYEVVHSLMRDTCARNAAITETHALEMSLALSHQSLYGRDNLKGGAVGGYTPTHQRDISYLVDTAVSRSDGDINRAALMACEYLRLAQHLSDTMATRVRNRGLREVYPRWNAVLKLLLCDTERLDVVDHLSVEGVIPLGLVEAMYLT